MNSSRMIDSVMLNDDENFPCKANNIVGVIQVTIISMYSVSDKLHS